MEIQILFKRPIGTVTADAGLLAAGMRQLLSAAASVDKNLTGLKGLEGFIDFLTP